jgi:inactivated superfamily I helicase
MLSYLRNQTIAFEGQPIEGVQVMGFIETRCIDFDRIIMLSVNEGVFPKLIAQSIIPYNLRKAYEMPVIEFQD